ncbi:putative membrane protein [hydrothermal vent metagenome]|uniref:Putative membrane protein n=1 Tax=hydrothermal vent metagenome TaxID=652676 RepID=A0A3B0VLU7_9ZZZZ
MPKKLIKRYIPTPEKIKSLKGLGFLGTWLHNPSIWHLHRYSVSKAFLIGLFWMAIPIPSQMLFAALCAIIFRANLPLSVILVWISNPLTMGPIFYFNYIIGTYILGQEPDDNIDFEVSWNWMMNVLGDLWQPLYLGSVIVGLTLGTLSFIIILLLWRQHVVNSWKIRKKQRLKR